MYFQTIKGTFMTENGQLKYLKLIFLKTSHSPNLGGYFCSKSLSELCNQQIFLAKFIVKYIWKFTKKHFKIRNVFFIKI